MFNLVESKIWLFKKNKKTTTKVEFFFDNVQNFVGNR